MGGRGLVQMVLGVALLARAVFASFDAYHHHWGRGAIVINVLVGLIAALMIALGNRTWLRARNARTPGATGTDVIGHD